RHFHGADGAGARQGARAMASIGIAMEPLLPHPVGTLATASIATIAVKRLCTRPPIGAILANMTSSPLFAAPKRFIPGAVNSPLRAFRNVGGEPFFVAKAK